MISTFSLSYFSVFFSSFLSFIPSLVSSFLSCYLYFSKPPLWSFSVPVLSLNLFHPFTILPCLHLAKWLGRIAPHVQDMASSALSWLPGKSHSVFVNTDLPTCCPAFISSLLSTFLFFFLSLRLSRGLKLIFFPFSCTPSWLKPPCKLKYPQRHKVGQILWSLNHWWGGN